MAIIKLVNHKTLRKNKIKIFLKTYSIIQKEKGWDIKFLFMIYYQNKNKAVKACITYSININI